MLKSIKSLLNKAMHLGVTPDLNVGDSRLVLLSNTYALTGIIYFSLDILNFLEFKKVAGVYFDSSLVVVAFLALIANSMRRYSLARYLILTFMYVGPISSNLILGPSSLACFFWMFISICCFILFKPHRIWTGTIHAFGPLVALLAFNVFTDRVATVTPDFAIPNAREPQFVGNMILLFILMALLFSYFWETLKRSESLLEAKQDVVIKQAAKLKEQYDMVSGLLNNMKQAVFAINAQKVIVAPVSAFAKEIFKAEIEGQNIFDVLFSGSDQNFEFKSMLDSTFSLIFGEDELQWKMSYHNLPKELDVNIGGRDRQLKISYNAIRLQNGDLEKLMFVIEDVTDLKAIEEQIRLEKIKNDRKIAILAQLYAVESPRLANFFKGANRLLGEIERTSGGENADSRQQLAKRNLHTLKGNCRAMGFTFISGIVHEAEQWIMAAGVADDGIVSQAIRAARVVISEYQDIASRFVSHSHATSVNQSNHGTRQKSIAFYEENFNRFRTNLLDATLNAGKISPAVLTEEFDRLNEIPVEIILEEQATIIEEMAHSLKKQVVYEFHVDFVTVSRGIADALADILLHAYRNAIDHGIESPETRRALGKEAAGRVVVSVKRHFDRLKFVVTDDGAGIDLTQVEKIAKSSGAFTAHKLAGMQVAEKLRIVLMPGISTRANASEYSGRGVGMEAVEAIVSSFGGQLDLQSQFGRGVTLSFDLPIQGRKEQERQHFPIAK